MEQAVRKPVVALAGNPNSGKTTLFNGLTGSNQHIGNWPGVTVEKKEGKISLEGRDAEVIDLPGIYSLSAFSEDERIARDFLLQSSPDVVINIVDGVNLERNLYLTAQLLEMELPLIVVVNMLDLAEKDHLKIDCDALAHQLKVPVIGISAVSKSDIGRVRKLIMAELENLKSAAIRIPYPNEIEEFLSAWGDKIEFEPPIPDTRWALLKLLEKDPWISGIVKSRAGGFWSGIQDHIARIERLLKSESDILLADSRYGFVHGISRSVVRKTKDKADLTDRIDSVVMNRAAGIPIFLAVMFLVFWVTMSIGGAFIDFFDILFSTFFSDGVAALLAGAPPWVIAVTAGGIGTGIATVASFIPILFFLFFMLALLEDSGYMARAAFVMDRFMRHLGLPGKSFVPMLVGFGCTVPGVMAARTLESKRDRYLTVFLTPFMSCGAKLPVYALFTAAFFGGYAGLVVFALYMIGIVFAILTGILMKKFAFKGAVSHFIMELPPYHSPRFKHILLHTWIRLKAFLKRAGVFIVAAAALLSFLNTFGIDGSVGNEGTRRSVLARLGIALAPVFEPMGVEEDNWPAAVSLFSGIFAKEAVVGTLNSLYGQMESGDDSGDDAQFRPGEGIKEAVVSIWDGLKAAFFVPAEEAGDEGGVFRILRRRFNSSAAFAYLLFVLLYLPCVAALGTVLKETGLPWLILTVVYFTGLAWAVSVLFYQIAAGGSLLFGAVSAGMIAAVAAAAVWGSRKILGRDECFSEL
ncbi:MAG: Fe(2+) transporter permease subunit FeoB [Spirochaetia bacterium]